MSKYRTTIAVSGPPGSGKTAMLLTIAKHLKNQCICVECGTSINHAVRLMIEQEPFTVGWPHLNLDRRRMELDPGTTVVLEEIDAQ